MAGQRSSFGKLQRDRAKKEKAAAKRERRHERVADQGTSSDEALTAGAGRRSGPEVSADQLLGLIESIHQRFEAGTISYEDFEQEKADLLGRLPID
ncbi:MAG: hypothetical protein M3N28_07540 [Actinomycetota bacterium]|nr:hypothetical protein [Actinomycetota bacterium]